MRRLISLLPLLAVVAGCIFTGCSSDPSAASATCGNGTVDPGETCDDGNRVDGDGCSSACTKDGDANPNCGNGKIDPGETCDDGNRVDGDGCPSTCGDTSLTCGDGKLDPGEACDDGNKVDGDGCQANCTKTVPVAEVACQTLAPLPSGTCEVKAGDGGRVIVGSVLTPDKVYRGGQVVADASGNILFVGCKAECDADPTCNAAAKTATTVTCPQGVVSPALINTHDHITYAQNSPYTPTDERYEHRHEWREGQNGHKKIPAPGSASADQVRWGELRFLFGGAVSTVGSGGQTGILRNLDKANMFEGLSGQKAVNFDTFPLGDSSGQPIKPTTCSADYPKAVTASSVASEDAYLPHVAEGIDARAEHEFLCLGPDNPTNNVLIDKSAFIHGVGLTAKDYGAMAANGTSLIWSPRSNITLYGNTAAVTTAARMGVNVALGTDWMPTGSMNLLRELQCADSFNKNHLGGFFTDYDLWMMVTTNAAAATAVDDVIGTLAKGKVADISIFDGSKHADYRAVIDAEPKDVLLVLRGGKPLYGDAGVVSAIPDTSTCDALPVCGSSKKVCVQGDIGKSFSDLEKSLGKIYAAFFCGAPENEPSCVPKRPQSVGGSTIYDGQTSAADKDGDGIPDAQDDCPTVFNPIRPLDQGKQSDIDGDGLGDVCDPCPLDANTTKCTGFNSNDGDGDGVPNASDNCPAAKNADQKDSDNDGKGDACDACPNAANPGTQACPGTIYQVKDGTIPAGSTVALTNQLVTGRLADGFFLQIKSGDPDYDANKGASNSGVYVYAPANTVKVGDRVTLPTATVSNYFGQIQLTSVTVNVVASNDEALPAPTVVTPAEVATNGTKAAALESVLVEVDDVTVTDIAPAVGAGDKAPTNEFVVASSLRVNDLLYLITPFPTVSQKFTYLRGILDYRNNDSKLELRNAGDVGFGSSVLVGFGPAQSYTDVGQSGTPTFPTPLTVEVAPAPSAATFITITSSDTGSLTVAGGGVTIPAGQTSAQVLVDAPANAIPKNVTLTATLAGVSKMANVRVIGAAEQPAVASLSPASVLIAPNGTTTLTVTLDIPAPAGGAVVDLAVTPANAGTLPMTVTVPANTLSTTFVYTDGGTATTATITATRGASTASSTINVGTCTATDILISEIRTRGLAPGGGNDDFVELYNPTNAAVTLDSSFKLEARSDTAASYGARWTGTGKVIPAHGHFLIGGSAYAQSPAKDESLSSGISDSSSVVLKHSNVVIDAVCFATDAATKTKLATTAGYTCEGTPMDNHSTNIDASIERKPGGTGGNCTDTGNNAVDFVTSTPANPQNLSSSPTP